MATIIQEVEKTDCIRRMKVRYTINRAVDTRAIDQFKSFGKFRVSMYDARKYLSDALVTYRISDDEENVLIAGALGLPYMDTTYQKKNVHQWKQTIEKIIEAM